jgi:hypothetical protein
LVESEEDEVPNILSTKSIQPSTSDALKPPKKKRRVVESDDDIQIIETPDTKPNPRRKMQATKDAQREELERIKRLAQKQAEFNGIVFGQ